VLDIWTSAKSKAIRNWCSWCVFQHLHWISLVNVCYIFSLNHKHLTN